MINEKIANLYNELIYNLLVEEQVEKIVCNKKHGNVKVKFFNDLYVDKEKGVVIVHCSGIKHDFEGFLFDFSVDYAECLKLIERGLFYANRRNNNAVGLEFTFSKEKQAYIDDDNNFIMI